MISELYLPTKGGTAVWFDSVYRLLGGKKVHIITSKVQGSLAHDKNHPNSVHRFYSERIKWLRPESLGIYFKILFFSIKLTAKYNFFQIHAGRVLPEGFVAWIVSKFSNCPVIIYAHGEEITTWRQPNKFRVMKFVFRNADCIIANSEFTEKELIKLGIKKNKIKKISPGVDLNRFKTGLKTIDLKETIGMDDKSKLILSVGRLTRRKGFDQTICAVSELNKKGMDVHYAIVGTGEDKAYLESIVNKNKLYKKVHFLGHVSEKDLPRWYNAADLFVMANREIDGDTEGFGMVFIEAGACGKPVIAGKAGGTGSAVIHGETGFRIDGNSTNELTDHIYQLLNDNLLSNRLGSNGYNRVRRKFSWYSVAEQTHEIIRTVKRGDQ